MPTAVSAVISIRPGPSEILSSRSSSLARRRSSGRLTTGSWAWEVPPLQAGVPAALPQRKARRSSRPETRRGPVAGVVCPSHGLDVADGLHQRLGAGPADSEEHFDVPAGSIAGRAYVAFQLQGCLGALACPIFLCRSDVESRFEQVRECTKLVEVGKVSAQGDAESETANDPGQTLSAAAAHGRRQGPQRCSAQN